MARENVKNDSTGPDTTRIPAVGAKLMRAVQTGNSLLLLEERLLELLQHTN